MPRHFLQTPLKIPVLIPDSREWGPESGLLRTAPTAITFIINNIREDPVVVEVPRTTYRVSLEWPVLHLKC